MRIAKEFNVIHYKCTLMLHDSKYTLKIADDQYEISYKWGDIGSKYLEELEYILMYPIHLDRIRRIFSNLHDSSMALQNEINSEDEFYTTII